MDGKVSSRSGVQVIEARRFHCGLASRSLREDHRRAVAAMGLDAHREITMRFFESSYRRAIYLDGAFAALWGVTGSILSDEGQVWLIVADIASKHPMKVVRSARAGLEEVMQIKNKLTTIIFDADAASLRFAHALGFKNVGYERLNGGLATAMVYEKGTH